MTEKQQTFRPPRAVQEAAAKGQALFNAQESPPALPFGAGVLKLATGEAVSRETVKEMRDLFLDQAQTPDSLIWKIAGGDPGWDWAEKILGTDSETEKAEPDSRELCVTAKVLKVDESLGVVMGWGIICTKKGEPYFDLQEDHIPDEEMFKAALDFMQHSRVMGEMHEADEGGSVVFAFPLTAEVAKAFGIETAQTGLMLGFKPAKEETLAKFLSGEYSGFSIAGGCKETPVEEENADA